MLCEVAPKDQITRFGMSLEKISTLAYLRRRHADLRSRDLVHSATTMSLPIADQKLPTVDVDVGNFPDTIHPPQTVVGVKADTSPNKFSGFLPASAILVLFFMFAGSTYNACGSLSDMSFVLFCYTILLCLFCCLRKYERLDSDAPPRVRRSLKAVILLLTTGLNAAFASRASELVPWPFAAVIWASAAFVAVVGYLALFVWSSGVGGGDEGALPYSKLDSNSNSNNNNNNCKDEEQYFFHNELSPEDKA